MCWEVEVVKRVALKISVDHLGLKLVNLFKKHLLSCIKEIDMSVDFLIQLRKHVVIHLHGLLHLIDSVFKSHVIVERFLKFSAVKFVSSLKVFNSGHDLVVN